MLRACSVDGHSSNLNGQVHTSDHHRPGLGRNQPDTGSTQKHTQPCLEWWQRADVLETSAHRSVQRLHSQFNWRFATNRHKYLREWQSSVPRPHAHAPLGLSFTWQHGLVGLHFPTPGHPTTLVHFTHKPIPLESRRLPPMDKVIPHSQVHCA